MPLKKVMKTILLLILIVFGVNAGAETLASKAGEPVPIHVDAPKPKRGGGDFYIVRITPAVGMIAVESIPESTVTFSEAGVFHFSVSVIHLVKGSCGGITSETYSVKEYTVSVK